MGAKGRNFWLPASLRESTFRASGNFGVGAKVMSDLVYVLRFSVAMETEGRGRLPWLQKKLFFY